MPIPSIVKQIGKSLEVRKKAKKEIDEAVNLSNIKENGITALSTSVYETDKPIRLLDEGAVMYEGGQRVRLFFMKGVVENFYNSLSDDFVGYINLAHIDVWSLPLNLGTWTKNDLSIVETENGRKALEVKAKLNRDLNIVQDLLKQEIPLSVSAELHCQMDWNKSFKLGYPCVNKIDIQGFSVVGNPANVSSSGVNLSIEGEETMDFEKLKALLSSKDEKEETLEVEVEEKEEKFELSNDQLDVIGSFMEKYEELQTENETLKAKIEELEAKEEEKPSKADEVIAKLESILNGTSTKEEKTSVGSDFMGLSNLDKGEK